MNLRTHQLEAVQAAQNINEGIIQLPTGSGKTRIEAALIIENIANSWKWMKENGHTGSPVFVVLTPVYF